MCPALPQTDHSDHLLRSAERTKAVVKSRHGSTTEGRLARGAAQARLGLETAGLATEGHRRRVGRQCRGGEPVAQTRPPGGGVEALARRPPPGMKSRLSQEQRAQIPGLLARGAEAHGFRGDVWTVRRVAEVIGRTFGVRYHRDHVSRLLRQLGWSRQQPIQRATQRDAAAIRQWFEQRWPALKQGPKRTDGPLSGLTSQASICCPWRYALGRHAAGRQSCGPS